MKSLSLVNTTGCPLSKSTLYTSHGSAFTEARRQRGIYLCWKWCEQHCHRMSSQNTGFSGWNRPQIKDTETLIRTASRFISSEERISLTLNNRGFINVGRKMRCVEHVALSRFRWGTLRGMNHLEDLGVGGRIILKFIFKKWDGVVDGFNLAQNRVKWRAQ